jgi:hypothetical protein
MLNAAKKGQIRFVAPIVQELVEPRKRVKRTASTAQLVDDLLVVDLVGKPENPDCLAYWRLFDTATGGQVINRFCYMLHQLVVDICFKNFDLQSVSYQQIRTMIIAAEEWYKAKPRGGTYSKSSFTCVYTLSNSYSLDLTEFPIHEVNFIRFVNSMYTRLRRSDNSKTTRTLYRKETTNEPSYDMNNFMKPLRSWAIFDNIQQNDDLRARSKYLHIITVVSTN